MKAKTLLYTGLIFLLGIVTFYFGIIINRHTTGLSIGDQGSSGDAFNGFAMPFIGVFSGILVYLAFREQVKANVLLSSNTQLETFTKLFAQIKQQVEELEFDDNWHESDASNEVKKNYDQNEMWYSKKFKGADAMIVFSHHLLRKEGKVGWYQKKFIQSLMLVYEDIILLERFIDNSRGEHTKYFYLKLNFYFQLAFDASFKTIYERLNDDKGEFYYMTIRNMERVRFVLSTHQSLEQKLFIKQQEEIELKTQIELDLMEVRGKKTDKK